MYRSYRRARNEEEEEGGFVYFPGDRTVFETPEGLDVQFKLRVLADLLKCPLCCGFFRNACTIRECLHTFCRSCIFKHLQQGGVSCPKCSEPISSNIDDAIGSDRSIQNLVDKLFHQFAEREANEITRLHSFCGIASSQSTGECKDLSAALKINSTSQNSDKSWCGGWDATGEFFNYVLEGKFNVELNLAFALFPAEASTPPLDRPYMRASSKMPLLHIMQYLTKKLNVEYPHQIEIFLEGMLLPKSHTLEFICRTRKLDASKCILLQYSIANRFGRNSHMILNNKNDKSDESCVRMNISCYSTNHNSSTANNSGNSTNDSDNNFNNKANDSITIHSSNSSNVPNNSKNQDSDKTTMVKTNEK